jgi:hypothetical protein
MIRKNNNSRNTQRMGNRTGRGTSRALAPKAYNSEQTITRRFRLQASSAVSKSSIGAAELSRMLGLVETAATTSVYLAYSVRLISVECWAWPSAVGTQASVQIDWNSNVATAGIPSSSGGNLTAVSYSLDRPAHVHSRPSALSNNAMWHTADDTVGL